MDQWDTPFPYVYNRIEKRLDIHEERLKLTKDLRPPQELPKATIGAVRLFTICSWVKRILVKLSGAKA